MTHIAWLVILLGASGIGSGASAASGVTKPPIRHGYVDMRYGQLHYSIVAPAGSVADKKTPIVLFHQSPNSSVEFDALVVELGKDRVAIAIDTPGYGGSDGPDEIPTIEDYAGAIAEGLKGLGYGPNRPVDVFGYHTGSKIAVELALSEPKMVRRVALSGIYVVSEERLQKALSTLVHPRSSEDLFDRFCTSLPRYKEMYKARGVPDPAWGRIRIDSMRSITRQEFGHEAAFRYTPRFPDRMSKVTQPVLLLVLDDGLAQETRDAKSFFTKTKATVVDHGFDAGAFFNRAGDVADALRKFQDAPK